MTRVTAVSSMLSEPMTPSLARQALQRPPATTASSHSGSDADTTPSIESIQEAVCSTLSVSRKELLSTSRVAHITQARQLSMFLARELTPLSLAQIARAFGRDHSTVLYAVRTVSKQLDPGSDASEMLDRVRQLINSPDRFPKLQTPAIHDAPSNPQVLSTARSRIGLP
jgi:chromosomal replication initiator protein